jgi:hypothetical protein
MQSTSHFQHLIIELGFGLTADIGHDMASLDSRRHLFSPHTHPGNQRVCRFVCGRQLLPPWLCLQLLCLDVVRLIALKTRIFTKDTAGRKHRGCLVTDAFVVPTASLGAAAGAHEPFCNVHNAVIFDRMRFFAARAGLVLCSLGRALHAPLRAIKADVHRHGPQDTTWRKVDFKHLVSGGLILEGPTPYIAGHADKYGPHGYMTLEFNDDRLNEIVHTPDGSIAYERQLV